MQKGITIFCWKIFVSKSRKILSRKPVCAVSEKFPVAKKFMDNGGGEVEDEGSIKIFRRNFLSHSAVNIRREIL